MQNRLFGFVIFDSLITNAYFYIAVE